MNRRLDRAFPAVLAAGLVVYLFLFGYYFGATMIRRPYWDMFHYIEDYLDYRQAGSFLHYLWAPYRSSEHRQVWMRLLTAVDIEVFRGVAYPFLLVATACLLTVPLLIWREVVQAGMTRNLTIISGCIIVLLVLTTANVVDCSVPIEGIYPHSLFFIILSLVLFDGAGEGERLAPYRRIASLVAAVGAGFACSVGLILWPILLWASWRGRLGWRWLTAVAVAGIVLVGLYTQGISVSSSTAAALHGEGGFYAPANLVKVGDCLLTFLGLPWTRSAALAIPGRLIGAALLVLGITVVLRRGFWRPSCRRLERIAVGLIMVSLGVAGLGAIARVEEQTNGFLPIRYSVFMIPMHLGLLCLALPWLQRQWSDSGRRQWAQGALLFCAGLLLVQQVAAGEAGARKAQDMRATIDRFMAGERDREMTRVVYGDLSYAQRIVDRMRREGIYADVN